MNFYGIYKITNLLNGKMYIGQHVTDNLDDGYMGSGTYITRAVHKYGVENFRKEWLMFCEDEEEMNYMERVFVDQTWIDRADTYNLVIGGGGTRGFKFTDEQKMKMHGRPAWNKGIPCSQEKKLKIAAKLIGRVGPNKGRKWSDEQKMKMSEAHKGKTTYMKGKHHSEETKKKISESKKGIRTSNGFSGKHHSEETRRRIADKMRGIRSKQK